MEYMNIAGITVSRVALGAGKRGAPADDAKHFEIMDRYRALGGNFFDSARTYENGMADEALGRYLKLRGCRASSVICTKGSFPLDRAKMYLSRLSPEEIEGDLDESLRAIGIECSDFHLLHRDEVKKPVSEIMPVMDRLVRAGKTRAIGCSNWTIGRIIEANEFALANGLTPFSVCQLHFSLAVTTAAQTGDITHVPMSDVEFGWYRESGFPIMGFAPQARGYFHAYAASRPQKPGNIRYYDRIPENRRRAERLVNLSRETGRSLAALLLAYSRDNALASVVLSAFSSTEQLEDAFGAMEFKLSPAQTRYLETGARE